MHTARQPYQHFRIQTDEQQLCWLTMDVKDKATNVLSGEVLTELREVLREVRQSVPKALLIQSAKQNGFIAGADINSFTHLGTRDEALALIRQGQDIFTELEQLPFPTVALLHGFCLGGGLELALACTSRIAADAADTRIGLPEVKLGIHPGFGGTVRLTRLIGGPQALPLILSGRLLNARQAAKLGVITHAVPSRLLRNAGIQVALSQPAPRKPSLLARLAATLPGRSLVAMAAERKLRQKVRASHYPAPYAVLDLYRNHGGSPSMMEQEAQSVADLITGETAQNLIRCFFLQERLKSLTGAPDFSPRYVHVIGAGVMGGDIAAWCALRGLRVSIQDNNHDILGRVVQRAEQLFQRQLKQPHLVTAAMDRFIPDMKGDHIPRADVIIEAIFEEVTAKKTLFAAIEPLMKKDVLFATNTSSIPLETLAADLQHPERLVGLHFFNPVAKMQLVEVVSTTTSSEESVRAAIQFTKNIGKLPLPVRSSPGFLVNRILMPYLHEAALLESEGVPAAAIDEAAETFGMPIGPIALIDMVGLDICQSVAALMGEHKDGGMMPRSFHALLQQGRLGVKTGAGYYTYSNGKPKKQKPGTHYQPPADLEDRLILRLVNESVACLWEEVVRDGDLLDAGMVYGTGFAPFRGGVIHYIEKQSGAVLHRRLAQLQQRYGERFRPDAGWGESIAIEAMRTPRT